MLQLTGNAFYESPVMLIQALMKRHQDLTAERNYVITKYRLETSAEAWNSRHGTEKEALLSLGIWGMELYRSAVRDSLRLNMIQLSNGKRAFMNKDDPGQIVLVSLDPISTACYCRFWIAYNCQCPHLLLLHNGCCRDLWAERWLQVPHLQSSVGSNEKENCGGSTFSQRIYIQNDSFAEGADEPCIKTSSGMPHSPSYVGSEEQENCGGNTLSQFTSTQNHSLAIGADEDGISTFPGMLDIGPLGVHDLAQEIAHNVTRVKN
jgi:hypothetical protein